MVCKSTNLQTIKISYSNARMVKSLRIRPQPGTFQGEISLNPGKMVIMSRESSAGVGKYVLTLTL